MQFINIKYVKLIEIIFAIGASIRGSDLGIDALEITAINKKNGFHNIIITVLKNSPNARITSMSNWQLA